jgi:hypothetical protein
MPNSLDLSGRVAVVLGGTCRSGEQPERGCAFDSWVGGAAFSDYVLPGISERREIRAVGFEYAPLDRIMERYDPGWLEEGYNHLGGEEVFFISTPALGLWAYRERFAAEDSTVCGLALRS